MEEEENTGEVGVIQRVRNHILFNSEINADSAQALVTALYDNALSIAVNCLQTGCPPTAIELDINSNGGSLNDTMEIIQVIKDIQRGKACKIGDTYVPIKVNTNIVGEADSGASLFACVGSHRTCSKYAMSLIHPMKQTSESPKTIDEQKVQLSNSEKWNKIYKSVYLQHSKLTEKQLDEILKNEETYTADELLSFGLVDEIV